MKRTGSLLLLLLAIAATIAGCQKLLPSAPNDNELLDGPIDGLSNAQSAQFLKGDVAFNDEIFATENGLGPVFVATSCGSCHAGDGKGHPFTTLTRFGQSDTLGNTYLHLGGPQLQNRAIPGYEPEQIPNGASFSKFTPPANTGLGFLELVSDADILALADPNDANGDGISGIPNWKTLAPYLTPNQNAISQNGKYIHRFGKKAAAYNLLNQTVNAYNQDMGVSSIFDPKDVYSHLEIDPEVSTQTVNDVVFYLQTLKAPARRNTDNSEVQQGEKIFKNIGCENCHKQSLKTGFSPVAGLSNKEFYPYTDLLLHDIGESLNDGYTEGSALPAEWRTAPLWGLGLSPNSQGGQYFLMHDGRAKSIQSAILMHGGEAKSSRDKYTQLNNSEQNAMVKFLESL